MIDLEQLPDWVQPSEESDLSLEATARNELLQLLSESDQPLEMALREATRFRKSEVAALAGQSLLSLGYSDVYFGGDGILNRKKQRAYWPDHFVALRGVLDQGGASAEGLRESIVRMDSANGEPI